VELKIDIEYEDLLRLVKQLPAAKIVQLKSELSDSLIENKSKSDNSEFQDFLLRGPVMTDNQYEQFIENRKWFNQWRVK
jgi:hypothetical protein